MSIWLLLVLVFVVLPAVLALASFEAKGHRHRARVKHHGCDIYRTGGGAR